MGTFKIRPVTGINTIGFMRGTNESVAHELVVITAHHDHLGIKTDTTSTGTDIIFNGAIDNASGVSVMLALAETLAKLKVMQRSVLFVSLTGEESGLLGAQHFIDTLSDLHFHDIKTRLPNRVVLNINFDIANVWGETTDIVGLGTEYSPTLKALFADIANKESLTVSPDPNPKQGSFFRSDSFIFAMNGIASLYVWTGKEFKNKEVNYAQQMRQEYVDKRYHTVQDDINQNNFSFGGLLQQARVALRLAYKVASTSLIALNDVELFSTFVHKV